MYSVLEFILKKTTHLTIVIYAPPLAQEDCFEEKNGVLLGFFLFLSDLSLIIAWPCQ